MHDTGHSANRLMVVFSLRMLQVATQSTFGDAETAVITPTTLRRTYVRAYSHCLCSVMVARNAAPA